MKIKVSEITKIIQERISNYRPEKQTVVGKVVSVGDGIAIVRGLTNVAYFETVLFSAGGTGLAFSLEENYVGVIILDGQDKIRENDTVKKSGQILSIPVSQNFLGRVVDPLGVPLDGKGEVVSTERALIEKIAPGVVERESVSEPLETGILALDALLPIGKGQRELIIGDRQTGKTAMIVDTMINQRDKDVICVYVAIGKKSADVLSIVNRLKSKQALSNVIVVLASAFESEAVSFLAPFAGMTHAEFFLSQGKDVLIIFDDLSKHAVAYRGLSLLLRRNPGRQAYPGDIFYLHSRLLERAVKLDSRKNPGSITALPIIETQMEDLTDYIPTNVISITDGQIFLLSKAFNLGFRPAVDFGLSVSRVGSAAQIPAVKQMVGSLKLDLATFNELKVFSQLGGSLDAQTKQVLERGNRIVELLKQQEGELMPQWIMSILLLAVKANLLIKLQIEQIQDFKTTLIEHFLQLQKTAPLVQELATKKRITPVIEKYLLTQLDQIIKNFNPFNDLKAVVD